MRHINRNRKPIYPYNEWKIIEEQFDIESNLKNETVFALGNGYIGMRGNFEEGFNGPIGKSVNGTYLNGFYESEPIIYGEEAYGYAKYSQTMLNVTDGKVIKLIIKNEEFDLFQGTIHSYKRVLDMKKGVLERNIIWESPQGKKISLNIKRLISYSNKHLAAISYKVTPLNFDGTISIISEINGEIQNNSSKGDPRAGSILSGQVLKAESIEAESTYGSIKQRTKNTNFTLAVVMENNLESDDSFSIESSIVGQMVSVKFNIAATENKEIKLSKYITYYTSRDYSETELLTLAKNSVKEAKDKGIRSLLEEQEQFLDNFWYKSDIQIYGDEALQQSIRFNIFHLLQSVGRDGKTNIGAKGLTGEGYEGHYFWDTETYILPFFLYTNPEISKKLLEYRYNTLDKARERAKELNHKGALYPWRTINGEETSAYYPASTAQYHINADIIYALKKYINATDDIDFLLEKGAEMVIETARFWLDLGDFVSSKFKKKFYINGVTGPDEYTALVNNNVYTNLMAKDNLEYAYQIAGYIRENHSKNYKNLINKINLNEDEILEWKKAADMMYIPFNEELSIYPQDDSFLNKAVWDFENTPDDKYPLLLHYHPLEIYRYQVLKQADLVLALYLQGQYFSNIDKKRNYDYYEPITTHDSSLSACIYSIIASEIGYKEKAYNYFKQTVRMDLDDINNNVKDGVHTAAMAGTWLSIFSGFAGVREFDGKIYFNPSIPEQWDGYKFKVTFRNRIIEINASNDQVKYTLLSGKDITMYHNNQPNLLELNKEIAISLKPKLEAVIFDLDGVITDTAEYHYLAWKKLADKLEIPFDREFNEQLKGISRLDSLNIILKRGNKELSVEEINNLAAEKNEYYKSLIESITPNEILPGILKLLQNLKAKGIKIGLASASKNAPTILEKLKISNYFDYVVDANKVKKGKPDPEIFITAQEALNIPVTNIIGIEDAQAGIKAIKDAGMLAIGVGDSTLLKEADVIVNNTEQLTFELLTELFVF